MNTQIIWYILGALSLTVVLGGIYCQLTKEARDVYRIAKKYEERFGSAEDNGLTDVEYRMSKSMGIIPALYKKYKEQMIADGYMKKDWKGIIRKPHVAKLQEFIDGLASAVKSDASRVSQCREEGSFDTEDWTDVIKNPTPEQKVIIDSWAQDVQTPPRPATTIEIVDRKDVIPGIHLTGIIVDHVTHEKDES